MNTKNPNNSPLILIADDDRFTRMLLSQIMTEEGYRVEEVEDGEQCLAAYTRLQPDMVLLDAMMPVIDGFTCCSQIQAHSQSDSLLGDSWTGFSPVTHYDHPSLSLRFSSGVRNASRTQTLTSHYANDSGVPVLMITGLNDQASVDWAFKAGATDFITKPIHPPVLRRRVRRILEASWAQKALRESEKKYRSVVENIKEVIFQTNTAGDWTFLNPAWTTLTGFTVEESLGTNSQNYVCPDDRQLHQELWQALIANEKASCRQEMRYLTKAGECRWVEIHAHSTLVTNGAITGLSGIIQDITKRRVAEALEKEKVKLETEIIERKRTEEVMRDTLEKEKDLGELKSRVITTISHEFRTPLTTILGSAELLKNYGQKWSDEKKLKHFQRIEESVEHMTKVLNDVILIGQTEAGQLELNPTQLDLEAKTREIIQEWQQSFENQQGENGKTAPMIVFSCQGNDTQANLDENLLQQMLMNLVSNAVKFSPKKDPVFFDLICQQSQAIFCVRDQGIGIPTQEQERVFETFYRASNVGTIHGLGLGLAIAKKCVDLLEGQITIKSQVDVGTTVTVTLPLNPMPILEGNLE